MKVGLKKTFQKKNNINRFSNKFEKTKIFSIETSLKEKIPSIAVGIAVIKNASIKKSDENLKKEFNDFVKSVEEITNEEIGKYPEVQSYRKLYKEMGIDWHSRRPSPEALLRRIAKKKGLYSINTCVDAYNLIVMKNRISVGAFDLDKIKFPTTLRYAKKGEEILLLGDKQPTKYKPGEIAYFDNQAGYNMDFNYRDSQRTCVSTDTKNIMINVDGVYNITEEMIAKTLQESIEKIIQYCGGTLEFAGIVSATK